MNNLELPLFLYHHLLDNAPIIVGPHQTPPGAYGPIDGVCRFLCDQCPTLGENFNDHSPSIPQHGVLIAILFL